VKPEPVAGNIGQELVGGKAQKGSLVGADLVQVHMVVAGVDVGLDGLLVVIGVRGRVRNVW
jgi:hypothetical protein